MEEEPKIGDYRLIREWSIERADWTYKLEQFSKDFGGYFIDERNNKATPEWCVEGTSEDVEWANRTADHFNLTIEDEEENHVENT